MLEFSSVQSLSRFRLFATPWTAALQAFLSIKLEQVNGNLSAHFAGKTKTYLTGLKEDTQRPRLQELN